MTYSLDNNNPLGPARRMAEFIGDVVSAATIGPLGKWRHSAVRCRRRPKHKPCPGRMMVCEKVNGEIEWRCPKCDTGGVINGWQRSLSDLSELREPSEPPFFEVVLTNEQHDLLKKSVMMDIEWDDIMYAASVTDGGIVLSADGPNMRAFADYLSSKPRVAKLAERRVLKQVLGGIQMVLGRWHRS